MARAKTGKKVAKKTTTRRGSPEAIAKRRAARSLNAIFEKGATSEAMDGRTLKRKRRLTKELSEGKNGQPLKAHEVLGHVTELLTIGENLTSIRKLKPRVPPTPPLTDDVVAAMRETQAAYGYAPAAWKVLGIDIDRIMGGASGTTEGATPKRKRGRPRKAA